MRLRKLAVRLVALTRHRRRIRRVKLIINTMRSGPQPREKGRALERLHWDSLVLDTKANRECMMSLGRGGGGTGERTSSDCV
jgi:hypothetical protein